MFTLRTLLRPYHVLSIVSLALLILAISWDHGEIRANLPKVDGNWTQAPPAAQLTVRLLTEKFYSGKGSLSQEGSPIIVRI